MLILPVVLVMIDVCFLVLGAAVNDATCRDAARACAAGPPAEAHTRANAVLVHIYHPSGAVRQLELDAGYPLNEITNQPGPDTGGPVTGQVTVRTSVRVYPPFLVQNLLPNKYQTVVATQTYPYTYVVPCTAADE